MTRRLRVLVALALVLPMVLVMFTDSDRGPDVVISEIMTSNASTLLDEDRESSDWIELWNRSSSPIDLVGWRLADGKGDGWELPRLELEPDERVVIFASGKSDRYPLHTDFRLSADGEYLGLHDATGRAISEYIDVPPLGIDVSFGVGTDNRAGELLSPTPGAPNTATRPPRAAKPMLDRSGGYIDDEISVNATTATDDAQIWYTTDGSTPSADNGTLYAGSIAISATTTLRMIATRDDLGDSVVASATFLVMDEVLAQAGTPLGWSTAPVNGQVYQYGFDQEYIAQHREQVAAALQAAPTLSITTDLSNLIDATTGIYSNATQHGSAWERPASIELIDGDSGFQINAGVRIKGGFFRGPFNPKHSFQIRFGPGYEGPLVHPLLGPDGPRMFASVDLRAEQNVSWQVGSHQNTMVREQFVREMQAAANEPTTRSRWVHMFLNGQYWGVYMLRDDVTAAHAAQQWGGASDAYDVLQHSDNHGYTLVDGDDDEWLELWRAIEDGRLNDDEFHTIVDHVDLESLATFSLINLAAAIVDGSPTAPLDNLRSNNWQAVRSEGMPFLFFLDDCELSLGVGDHDVGVDHSGPFPITDDNEFWEASYFNPSWLHQVLLTRDEYRQIYRNRASVLLAPDGALAAEASLARWVKLRDQVDPLIEAEAARWGYAGSQELGRPAWEAEVAWVEEVWFRDRTAIVIDQLRADDLL